MDNDVRTIVAAAVARHGSLYRVAKMIGVRWDTANAWKQGKTAPRWKHMSKLLDLAGKMMIAGAVIGGTLFSPQTEARDLTLAGLQRISTPIYTLCAAFGRWVVGLFPTDRTAPICA